MFGLVGDVASIISGIRMSNKAEKESKIAEMKRMFGNLKQSSGRGFLDSLQMSLAETVSSYGLPKQLVSLTSGATLGIPGLAFGSGLIEAFANRPMIKLLETTLKFSFTEEFEKSIYPKLVELAEKSNMPALKSLLNFLFMDKEFKRVRQTIMKTLGIYQKAANIYTKTMAKLNKAAEVSKEVAQEAKDAVIEDSQSFKKALMYTLAPAPLVEIFTPLFDRLGEKLKEHTKSFFGKLFGFFKSGFGWLLGKTLGKYVSKRVDSTVLKVLAKYEKYLPLVKQGVQLAQQVGVNSPLVRAVERAVHVIERSPTYNAEAAIKSIKDVQSNFFNKVLNLLGVTKEEIKQEREEQEHISSDIKEAVDVLTETTESVKETNQTIFDELQSIEQHTQTESTKEKAKEAKVQESIEGRAHGAESRETETIEKSKLEKQAKETIHGYTPEQTTHSIETRNETYGKHESEIITKEDEKEITLKTAKESRKEEKASKEKSQQKVLGKEKRLEEKLVSEDITRIEQELLGESLDNTALKRKMPKT
jgi:hypothetical protein